MENFDYAKAYEEFREAVKRLAKESLDKELMNSFIKRTKNMRIKAEETLQAFSLCVKLLELLDTDLMKGLMRRSKETNVKLAGGILELVGQDPSQIAMTWGMAGIPFNFDMNYIYREARGFENVGIVGLISIEKKNGKYRIENVNRRVGAEAIRRYLETSAHFAPLRKRRPRTS